MENNVRTSSVLLASFIRDLIILDLRSKTNIKHRWIFPVTSMCLLCYYCSYFLVINGTIKVGHHLQTIAFAERYLWVNMIGAPTSSQTICWGFVGKFCWRSFQLFLFFSRFLRFCRNLCSLLGRQPCFVFCWRDIIHCGWFLNQHF